MIELNPKKADKLFEKLEQQFELDQKKLESRNYLIYY